MRPHTPKSKSTLTKLLIITKINFIKIRTDECDLVVNKIVARACCGTISLLEEIKKDDKKSLHYTLHSRRKRKTMYVSITLSIQLIIIRNTQIISRITKINKNFTYPYTQKRLKKIKRQLLEKGMGWLTVRRQVLCESWFRTHKSVWYFAEWEVEFIFY